jgi:tRNA delta(2)-isopentenylpyrophosphate transferase
MRCSPRARSPVVAGGTGLYLRAALVELGLPPAPPADLRARWEQLYDRLGAERAHDVLVERDPDAAAHIHANDRRRVVRALELTELGSSLHPESDRLWTDEVRHQTLIFGLEVPRDVLLHASSSVHCRCSTQASSTRLGAHSRATSRRRPSMHSASAKSSSYRATTHLRR